MNKQSFSNASNPSWCIQWHTTVPYFHNDNVLSTCILVTKKIAMDITKIKSQASWNDFQVRLPGSKKNKCNVFNNFYNSISLYTLKKQQDVNKKERTVCAKVFRNGGVQLTGCQSEEECDEIIKNIMSILADIMEYTDLIVANQTVNMINIACRVPNVTFDLTVLSRQLLEFKHLQISYDREKYFGLIVKTEFGGIQFRQENVKYNTHKKKNPKAHY